jgi:hypothetical protein
MPIGGRAGPGSTNLSHHNFYAKDDVLVSTQRFQKDKAMEISSVASSFKCPKKGLEDEFGSIQKFHAKRVNIRVESDIDGNAVN